MAETLMQRVAAEAKKDPTRIRPVLQLLVGDEPDHRAVLRPLAVRLNASRQADALAEFQSGAWTTEQVQAHLDRLNSRQAVHSLRDRGRLWGRTIGNATYFPRWQFAGGDLRQDLPRILGLLARFSADALAADRVMRLPRPELDGASIVEGLDDRRRAKVAWQVLDGVGGGD